MGKLTGKRVVVTGASRGLGRGIALSCASEGAKLVINATNSDLLAQVASEIDALGTDVVQVVGSVSEEDVCKQMVDRGCEAFGGVDVMVANAGIVRDRSLLKMSVEEFDDVIAVNLRGAFLCMREAARAMAGQAEGGHIIHVSSAAGLTGFFGQTNYAAAKAGVLGMVYTASRELARKNIRCNALVPLGRTDMTQGLLDSVDLSDQEKAFGEPEDIGQAVVWMASDAASHWNGQTLSASGNHVALWQPPHEVDPSFSEGHMSIEQRDKLLAAKSPLALYDFL